MLAPRGVMQHRFRQRVPVCLSGDEQHADGFRFGCAARFAGAKNRDAEPGQKIGKPGGLGRFSGPVAALEGYQPTRHAAGSKPKIMARTRSKMRPKKPTRSTFAPA